MPELSERLDGRVALVTGAASGIGAACATLLRERGADVLGTDIAPGADFVHDVTSEPAWNAAIAEAVARHGRLDILVSNAGTACSGPIVDLTLADFRRHSRVHVEGAFLGIRAAAAQMRAQGSPAQGSIVVIASIAGIKPIMQTTTYGTAKAAQINLVRSAGVELGRKGDFIRVNAVAPGGTRTPMTEAMFGGPAYWDAPESFARLPLKDYARPRDIAEGVAWLASDAARFVTAQTLVIDGGWVLTA